MQEILAIERRIEEERGGRDKREIRQRKKRKVDYKISELETLIWI